MTYDWDGAVNMKPEGFYVPGGCFQLILITHDESMFYSNDWHESKWMHTSENPTPEHKGDGVSLMVSDFLVPEWGWVQDNEE